MAPTYLCCESVSLLDWTMLHPEIESEEDMLQLMRGHEQLAQLLLEDPEADRSDMSERTFMELAHLRELNERRELQAAKRAVERHQVHSGRRQCALDSRARITRAQPPPDSIPS
jgi:hypothetical protein